MDEEDRQIRPRLMIVEDEVIIASSLKERLENSGYEICSMVTSGEEAIDLARKERPDLILMDIILDGDLDGIEAAEIIREETGAPVVFVTAYGDELKIKRAKAAHPYGYIIKPVKISDLKATIEVALYVAKIDDERRAAEDALRHAYNGLEKTVRDRTAELTASNKKLKQEIAERKKAEAALRESEEHLRAVVESARDFAVFRLKYDQTNSRYFQVVFVSPSIIDLSGEVDPNNFDTWFETVHPDDRDRILESHERSLTTRDFNETMRIYHSIKREWRWIHVISRGLPEEKGPAFYTNGIFFDVTEQKEAEEKLLTYQSRLRQMSAEMSLIEERERRHIAMDLHDRIGQSLAISKLKLKMLHRSTQSDEIRDSVNDIHNLIDQMISETRTLTIQLSPPVLYELGLLPALEWLAETFTDKYGLTIKIKNFIKFEIADTDIRVMLFRALYELLINVVKHSSATLVDITIQNDQEVLFIEVWDDGTGFDPEELNEQHFQNGGFGLFSIRERLNSLGGELSIKSNPGRGSNVCLSIPIIQRMI